jgi:N,N'-diacetyllegionaminate synthase
VHDRCLIIAEVGVNHNGSPDLAKNLVDAAVGAGADVVKFQTFKARSLSTEVAEKAEYQSHNSDTHESQYAMLRKLELSCEMHVVLLRHCDTKGIEFLSSAFDIDSLDYLHSLGLHRFKIPSGEISNLPYLRHIGRMGKPIIISTGMSSIDEVNSAIVSLERSGTPRSLVTVLHCNTEYPTPMEDVNLMAMCTMREALGVKVGYSDHTSGIEVSIAAVAMGATVIEKHLTLDRNLPGPDHRASLEPDEFAKMVNAIRNIESARGDGVKRPSNSEAKNITAARKSLVAAKPIFRGEVFTPENVTTKRPGNGISPMRWDDVIGQVARKDFSIDELITI